MPAQRMNRCRLDGLYPIGRNIQFFLRSSQINTCNLHHHEMVRWRFFFFFVYKNRKRCSEGYRVKYVEKLF